ncbi:hypothetical protein TIFTF001_016663 [Ficus carica]|uniref:Uncharacterized protein n=1 Tax=Ficus carica TaxID=3494 RepID=A0AA88D8Y5_FICCA|nr:hypothetical protein TIFTF001_016663 [Ficus carica]
MGDGACGCGGSSGSGDGGLGKLGCAIHDSRLAPCRHHRRTRQSFVADLSLRLVIARQQNGTQLATGKPRMKPEKPNLKIHVACKLAVDVACEKIIAICLFKSHTRSALRAPSDGNENSP